MSRHRASSMINMYGLNFCADHTNGLIYEYSPDIYSDNGDPIIKQRDTAVIHGGLFGVPGKKLFFDEVEFIIVAGQTEVEGTGQGAIPVYPPGTPTYQPTSWDGYTYTQDAFYGDPDFAHPFAGESYNAFTMSAVFSMRVKPDTADPETMFSISGFNAGGVSTSIAIQTAPGSGLMSLLWGMGSFDTPGGSATSIATGGFTMGIGLSPYAYNDYWWVGVSYDSVTGSITSALRNLTRGDEYLATGTLVNQIPMEWLANGPGGASSICAWGTSYSEFYQRRFQGPLSQVLLHNEYIDLSVLANRNKFCCSTGVIDLGTAGIDVFGVVPLVYIEDGYPENNLGTKFIGLPSDFYEKVEYFRNIIVPPLCPGYEEPGLPDPPTTPTTEIVAPYWENTGTYIDLTGITNTTFASMFGVAIEDADFDAVFAVNKAALVNTSDAGNRIQIQDSTDCTNAYLAVTDATGVVLDSMIYANAPNGNSVLVPTGADYYVVCTSDTGNAKIKKWDSSVVSTVGSVAWESFFDWEFRLNDFYNKLNTVPREGASIRFTIPETTSAYKISFTLLEVPSNPGLREGAVNQTVGDFTSGATYTWGLGGGIDCGVNYPGQDIDLIPGQTYFFNVRDLSPSDLNYLQIQVSTLAV